MQAIMISIQPQWVEKILNGEKTIEIRKTRPKIDLPCKVYIYCTKGQELWGDGTGETWHGIDENEDMQLVHELNPTLARLNGKVVAEFTLNRADEFSVFENGSVQYWNSYDLGKSCLTYDQIAKYIGYNKKYGYRNGYAWFIDNLKVYDILKELSEFRKNLDCDDYPCNKNCDCKYNYYDTSEGCWACGIDFDGTNCIYKQIKKPPQSWCYVEELCKG